VGESAGGLRQALELDPGREVDRITHWLRREVGTTFRRRGGVVGISGGVDSAVTAALAVRAFGQDKVAGLFMPDRESDPTSLELGELVARRHRIATTTEDITDALTALGCYERRDAALRSVLPQYGQGWKFKLVLPSLLGTERYRISSVVAQSPDGDRHSVRLPPHAYRAVVAATSFKQRARKMVEFYHADLHHFAVLGTPNRLEYDQGFFVKNGDGAADVKPIAHLYKSQVYQLAEFLGVPREIRERPPTTDTYSLAQCQEEFFFSVPYETMDLCLYGMNEDIPIDQVAKAVGLTPDDVQRVFDDMVRKQELAKFLHASPLTLPFEASAATASAPSS
jgi:NAD+ synthase